MPIKMQCPDGHPMLIRDEHLGKQVKCPKCRVSFPAVPVSEPENEPAPKPTVAAKQVPSVPTPVAPVLRPIESVRPAFTPPAAEPSPRMPEKNGMPVNRPADPPQHAVDPAHSAEKAAAE